MFFRDEGKIKSSMTPTLCTNKHHPQGSSWLCRETSKPAYKQYGIERPRAGKRRES
jgi:hypothetical protein